MMSGERSTRQYVDLSLSTGRARITQCERILSKLNGVTHLGEATRERRRTAILGLRQQLSLKQREHKVFARRQDAATRPRPTSMIRGVAFRIV